MDFGGGTHSGALPCANRLCATIKYPACCTAGKDRNTRYQYSCLRRTPALRRKNKQDKSRTCGGRAGAEGGHGETIDKRKGHGRRQERNKRNLRPCRELKDLEC